MADYTQMFYLVRNIMHFNTLCVCVCVCACALVKYLIYLNARQL